ncbi:hypothetical protein RHP47_06690 [Thermosynechococcus sp. QKsg1]|uniref:hypothetical protein n=1 Tax=unclassified Thermosynechococcus TaxID=2622553 RepID=UPI00122E45AC|nr:MULTISPECIES: hypothetical protein [unclassified Thermosynechococcus]QEQ01085.1 hypothetical protein FFX45_06675 [Thermosynechococcus sp. CL-1]WKT85000.1 hypothetical protein QYC28_06695 [Thermosynechococcus sp. HY596]WNC64134.1 hypothetical protein RHK13_06690 [Thermosynechococcus sp. HY591]WNC66703.1 hypothetical protein RHK28_06725 [Thermosynechococcus sp. HY593]WNC85539.1 hypothetical protein RHP47_06690 [Thermosynechococcus sp. QKsg1]
MFKQRTKIITIAAGLLASTMSSCGFMVTETEITDQPVAPPAAAPTTPEPTEPGTAGSAVAALTPPTNPKTYIEGLSNIGRPNPFEPVPPPDTGGVENGGMENGGTVEGGGNGTAGTVGNGAGTGGTASRPTPPPPPPPPVDAQAVKVFGVAAVNGRLQAIIRSPKENVTRTVQVGDTIAGNVLVRAIDAYDTTPAVVLEQFGQTVRLTVGQPATAQGATPPAI